MAGAHKFPEAGAHREISRFLGGPVRPLVWESTQAPQRVRAEPSHQTQFTNCVWWLKRSLRLLKISSQIVHFVRSTTNLKTAELMQKSIHFAHYT